MENDMDMGQEQAADLARLEQLAAGDEPGQGAAPEPEPAPVDPVESLAALLSMGGMAAGFVGYRRVAELWNGETCAGVAARAVPVMRKYPWGIRALDFLTTGAGVEEMALAVYLAPLALATMQAARADSAELRRPAKKAEPEPIEAERVEPAPAQAEPGMEWAAP